GEEQQRRILTARAKVGTWVALLVMPLVNVVYVGAYHPSELPRTIVVSCAIAVLLGLLLLGIRRNLFSRSPLLPYFILVGVVGNSNVAFILHLTSEASASPFY